MEFECICTPPWEEKHEFVLHDNDRISDCVIRKKQDFKKNIDLPNGGKVTTEKLGNGETIQSFVESNYVEAYYFSVGIGTIIVNDFKKQINESECFLVYPNDIVVIHAESDMIFSKVKDQNNLALNKNIIQGNKAEETKRII